MEKPIAKTSWTSGTPNNRIEPGDSKKNTGFLVDERPGFQHFNWLIWILEQWINYLEEKTDLLTIDLDNETTSRIQAINALITKLACITYDSQTNKYTFTAEIIANLLGNIKSSNGTTILNAGADGTNAEFIGKIKSDLLQIKTPSGSLSFKNEAGTEIGSLDSDGNFSKIRLGKLVVYSNFVNGSYYDLVLQDVWNNFTFIKVIVMCKTGGATGYDMREYTFAGSYYASLSSPIQLSNVSLYSAAYLNATTIRFTATRDVDDNRIYFRIIRLDR